MKIIDIGKDFSIYPAGRYPDDGEFNGELFRKSVLLPCLVSNGEIEVHLDGTLGYDSSFLEEAFGGIFREMDVDISSLMQRMKLVTEDDFLRDEILSYMQDADRRRKRDGRK